MKLQYCKSFTIKLQLIVIIDRYNKTINDYNAKHSKHSVVAPDIHTTDLSASGTAGQTEITEKTPSVPSSKTIDRIDWTEASTTEPSDPDPEERTSGSKKLVQWGLVSGFLTLLAVAVAILLCWIRRRRKRRRRTRKKNEDSNGSAHQSTPLMQQRK